MFTERKTVLVVEDQKVNRQIISKILLAEEEYDVIEAVDGLEGIAELKRHPEICVILLDIVMPNMNGYQFLEKIKDIQKESIPIIVMTADMNVRAEEKALDLGAIDFITKPVTPKILKSRLRNAIIRNQMFLLEQLKYKADYDDLTGLYNRNKMFSETKKMLENNKEVQFAFIRFDIDQFRLYNSAMGENEGNKLLKYIAQAITKLAKDFEFCTYARIDADIFCMCVPYQEEILKKHVALAQNEMNFYRDDYVIDTSFGIYIIDDISVSVESMFTKASMASDRCKNLYDEHLAYYEKDMSQRIHEEQEIINEMQTALSKKQFKVYLQPKYDLNTDTPCGAEALVRWLHPQKGLVSPAKFIPVFEKNGFIARLDYYMWESVCALLKRWKEEGRELYPISVNMSRVSLYNPHVKKLLVELVDKYCIDVKLLNLEITESAYMSNPDLMKETIHGLQEAGFLILMDDFGSGYSSLNTLKEIEVDILKIDMKFLPNGQDNGRGEKIISSIVRMAGWLGMPVIAEGVEKKDQKDFLESIGCGYVQGYYYAKPMPVDDYEALMHREAIFIENQGSELKDDANAIWSSNEQIEQVLKGISLPVAIFEYSSKNTEIVRVNQSYLDCFNISSGNDLKGKLEYNYNEIVKDAFEQAIDTEQTIECRFPHRKGSKCTWFSMKVKKLGSIPKSAILCGIFLDITAEILYEQQLKKIEYLFQEQKEKKKLLVIDDLEISREIIRAMFEHTYEIIEANNGKEGIDILCRDYEDVAVILLDMLMPKMNGEEFLKYKNQVPEIKNIPVIIISSEDNAAVQLGMLKLGVNDYITKPFNREIVEQRIKNVIDYNSRFHLLLSEYHSILEK